MDELDLLEIDGHRRRICSTRNLWLVFLIFFLIPSLTSLAQSQPRGTNTSSLCTRNSALDLIRQQIEVSKTISDPVQRITVLIRAADLLWFVQEDKARAGFTEAFEVASQYEKEQPEPQMLLMFKPDQRYVVILAVAKRDSAWARKLTQQALKQNSQRENESTTKNSRSKVMTAQRLLASAQQLIPTDLNTAMELARTSLRYPASAEISRFLYKLAETNQQAADQFYLQSLTAYADRPMREFLYLTAYPFALSYGGDMPVFSWYQIPSSFVVNPALRRQFVQTLVHRAEQALEVPLDEGDNFNQVSGAVHIWQVLTRIESPVRDSLPDLVEAVVQAKDRIFVSSSQEIQQLYVQPERITDTAAKKTFAEQIEDTLKTADPNKREEFIVQTILSLSENERVDVVMSAIDKIDDSTIRGTLKDWVYFNRANLATKEKRFDEAESLVSKIDGLEQRAFLHSEIARALFSKSETHAHGREVLDEAIVEAKKAGPNVFTARILLTASNVYSIADLQRSILVLGEAITYVNQIEDPDFSVIDRAISNRFNPGMKEIKGKNYSRVVHFYIPGLDPESALREMAKIDFNDAFSQTTSFTNKFIRATTTLAVADVCLQRLPKKTTR